MCGNSNCSKPLESQLDKLRPEEIQSLPTRRPPSPENKALGRTHLVVEDLGLLVGGRHGRGGGGRQQPAALVGPGGGKHNCAQHAEARAGVPSGALAA